MRMRFCIGLLLGLACASHVFADPPSPHALLPEGGGHAVKAPHHFWQRWWTRACPSIGCCPDDYVRKPMPPICPLPCGGGPDDYCRKPMPYIRPVPCGGSVDDYCRKPLPYLLCPPLSPYLQCGTSHAACVECDKRP
jgi:hypothetical protein